MEKIPIEIEQNEQQSYLPKWMRNTSFEVQTDFIQSEQNANKFGAKY